MPTLALVIPLPEAPRKSQIAEWADNRGIRFQPDVEARLERLTRVWAPGHSLLGLIIDWRDGELRVWVDTLGNRVDHELARSVALGAADVTGALITVRHGPVKHADDLRDWWDDGTERALAAAAVTQMRRAIEKGWKVPVASFGRTVVFGRALWDRLGGDPEPDEVRAVIEEVVTLRDVVEPPVQVAHDATGRALTVVACGPRRTLLPCARLVQLHADPPLVVEYARFIALAPGTRVDDDHRLIGPYSEGVWDALIASARPHDLGEVRSWASPDATPERLRRVTLVRPDAAVPTVPIPGGRADDPHLYTPLATAGEDPYVHAAAALARLGLAVTWSGDGQGRTARVDGPGASALITSPSELRKLHEAIGADSLWVGLPSEDAVLAWPGEDPIRALLHAAHAHAEAERDHVALTPTIYRVHQGRVVDRIDRAAMKALAAQRERSRQLWAAAMLAASLFAVLLTAALAARALGAG